MIIKEHFAKFGDIVTEIAAINKSVGAPYMLAPVQNILQSDLNTIDIAIVGQFKSGKSSLVNTLIEMNLVPTGVIPVTAVVTILQYGEKEQLDIYYQDKTVRHENLDELSLYVTERQNPENIRKVNYVVVNHPKLSYLNNLRIVDTPGLGSFYAHNSDATSNWMPFTGAALVAVSAERPLSEEDISLINAISLYCPDVALILTKTDLFNLTDLGNIKTYINDCLAKGIAKPVPVYEFSCIKNSSKHRTKLLEEFVFPFSQNTDANLVRIIRHKLLTIAGQSIQYCELALQSALRFETAKEQIAQTMQELINHRHYREREMLLTVTNFKGEIRPRLEKIFLPYFSTLTNNLNNKFSSWYAENSGALNHFTHKFEAWLTIELANEITTMDADNFSTMNVIVKEISDYLQYTGLQFKRQLDEKLFAVFNVHMPDVYWQVDYPGVEKPDISIFRAFESHLDMLLFFLPMNHYTKKLFEKHFRKQIPTEIEKNIERYISNLTSRIFITINQIHQQSSTYMHDELEKIQQIVRQSENNSVALNEKLVRLREMHGALLGTN